MDADAPLLYISRKDDEMIVKNAVFKPHRLTTGDVGTRPEEVQFSQLPDFSEVLSVMGPIALVAIMLLMARDLGQRSLRPA